MINKILNFLYLYVFWIFILIVNVIILFLKIIKGISVLCYNDCVNKFFIIRIFYYVDLFVYMYIYDVYCSWFIVLII